MNDNPPDYVPKKKFSKGSCSVWVDGEHVVILVNNFADIKFIDRERIELFTIILLGTSPSLSSINWGTNVDMFLFDFDALFRMIASDCLSIETFEQIRLLKFVPCAAPVNQSFPNQ